MFDIIFFDEFLKENVKIGFIKLSLYGKLIVMIWFYGLLYLLSLILFEFGMNFV